MSFHVPFEHRRNGQPIYIGFNSPPRRPRFNWWAFFGFPFSLFSLLTAGLLSPIALLINLVALRKGPRRLATAGTIISLAGVGLLTSILAIAGFSRAHEHHQIQQRRTEQLIAEQSDQTIALMRGVVEEFHSYAAKHENNLPDWVDANMVADSYRDSWGTELRFDAEETHALLRSAGPDKRFDTPDDLTKRIEGKASREVARTVDL